MSPSILLCYEQRPNRQRSMWSKPMQARLSPDGIVLDNIWLTVAEQRGLAAAGWIKEKGFASQWIERC
jgi:hypothetical protein